jgi:branched-chain amino acid transport system substrate-binding protein
MTLTTRSQLARPVSRRALLGGAAAAAAVSTLNAPFVLAQPARIKVGLMLPYSGTFAALGNNITDALTLAINEKGGKLGGREVQYVRLDDESEPPKAAQNTNKLVVGEKVDILVGTVHSGVAMGMVQVVREEGTTLIIPNAGAGPATGALCSPNIFRTSFSNWQPAYPMGKVMYDLGHRNVVTMTWKYAAGEESMGGFKDGFTALGGKIVKEIALPFPDVEFQAHLTEIASLKPDAVFVFFAGGGAVKFVKDYDAAGLRKTIPLYGSGFLTDGTLQAQGAAADGLLTTLHYVEDLPNPVNQKFKADFQKATNRPADVYAVQGYDSGQLLVQALDAVKGDAAAKSSLYAAMRNTKIVSPRGEWTFSKAQNPVQDIYLRKVVNGENRYQSVAHKALADPATGCKLA